jgi:hypothetical protein
MNPTPRTQRTFGVTAHLEPEQRRNLLNLQRSETYPDLLDVLEMVCIEMETQLINTDADDEKSVLANHKMAKAAWQMFTHMQEKIDQESGLYLQSITPSIPIPPLTPEEAWTENTLDPTKYPDEAKEYMGQ